MAERRIRRPADKKDTFDKLVDSDVKIFDTYKDLMVFAACIGFKYGSREPVVKSLEPIQFSIFTEDDKNIIKLIAFADTKDINILRDSDEAHDGRATIFEEYANGGLAILRSIFQDVGVHVTLADKLADFTLEKYAEVDF